MYNPSYLIQSRHNIYYFRFPLPSKPSSRVSISLKTRCPKEALRIAKQLEYNSTILLSKVDLLRMDYAEIMAMLKNYYAEVLKETKGRIDRDGLLTKETIANIKDNLKDWEAVINEGVDDYFELLGVADSQQENNPTKVDLQKVMEHSGLSFEPGSKEYSMMKQAYKHVKRNYLQDVLTYNNSVTDFSLLESSTGKAMHVPEHKPGHKLGSIIQPYLKEKRKEGMTTRSHKELSECLSYLTDWLGADFPIDKMDNGKAREAKGLLMDTPKGRNKNGLIGKLPLLEQITTGKEHNLPCLGKVSVNKYLAYFDNLFGWAKDNRYTSDNIFSGIRVKAEKKKDRRRKNFSKDEVSKIIASLQDDKLVKNKSNYWGALIAIYTGARRNEIAGLLAEDVKKDEASGIWYFNITDEEEGKTLKTEAARRIVPIHPKLIELGFLEFLDKSLSMKDKLHKDGHTPRLLYDLTYSEHEKWGRNLGRWFNERYLKSLGLKQEKKTLHSLRHSFITCLSAAGVSHGTIQSLVGHEPDTVTTQVYTHYGVDHLPVFSEAIEKISYQGHLINFLQSGNKSI